MNRDFFLHMDGGLNTRLIHFHEIVVEPTQESVCLVLANAPVLWFRQELEKHDQSITSILTSNEITLAIVQKVGRNPRNTHAGLGSGMEADVDEEAGTEFVGGCFRRMCRQRAANVIGPMADPLDHSSFCSTCWVLC